MVVSHQHRYVFLHIPRTAGTSVEGGLGLLADRGGLRADACTILGRTKHHVEPELIPKEYLVFSFVRNPWDRILSYYLFRQEARNLHRNDIHPDERSISFHDWLTRLNEFSEYIHINPAFQLAIRSQNSLIQDYAHFVGRYENLAGDFHAVCQRIGLEPKKLRHLNSTRKAADYSGYYTQETVEIVARLYRDDIERFGYGFE